MAAKNESNEIVLHRIYDAPVKMVWDAWTDPKQAAKWWGPRGFTITTKSKDFRVGGTWIYTMHGPDGTDYPNVATYHEIEKYARMVYDHGASEVGGPPLFRVTVNFKEIKGKTHMDMTMTLETPEKAKTIKGFIKQAGGNATWDRLAEYLADGNGKNEFFINRSFDVSAATLFKMWTDPKHFSQWLPPTGFTMEFKRSDIRTGGETVYKMTNGKDITMWGKSRYIDVSPNARIQYTQEFIDEKEDVSRHPLSPVFPPSLLTTIIFTEEGSESTRVTVTMEPYGTTTPEELNVFREAKPGMTMGWTGSFDKLEDLLKQN